MLFDLTIIGFGVIAVETLHGIQKEFKNKKKKVFKIAIVEKDINNFLGGVAYSKAKSRFGYFNNPLRLSHPDFIKWININENKKKIINFIKQNPKYNLNDWLDQNLDALYNDYDIKAKFLGDDIIGKKAVTAQKNKKANVGSLIKRNQIVYQKNVLKENILNFLLSNVISL